MTKLKEKELVRKIILLELKIKEQELWIHDLLVQKDDLDVVIKTLKDTIKTGESEN